MKNRLFRIFFIPIVGLALQQSCSPSKEEKLDDFVTHFNQMSKPIQNSTLKFIKSEKTSSNQVTLYFKSPLNYETAEISVVKASLVQLI